MKYRKIEVVYTDCPKRFYRIMYVRSYLNLMQLGYAVLKSLRCEFGHAYLFRDKDNSYIPEEWLEDVLDGEKALTEATLDDVYPFSDNKIIFEYDTGDGWEFEIKIYKEERR